MPLTRKQRHDTYDIDRRELKLIRVGHYLWALYKREQRRGSVYQKERGKFDSLREQKALETALQTVWDLKKTLRQELKVERAAQSLITRERFRQLKTAA
jgi:hypothetical protein